jgi:transcriptional regulator with XRE-family HTH domain
MDTRAQTRSELASFLRSRRAALSPADVGLAAIGRRRTPGLRRDEVAGLASMSVTYYERLEQGRGPQPSPAVLAAIALSLQLSAEEREYLHLLAGQAPPPPGGQPGDLDAGLITAMESLTPVTIAFIVDGLGTVLSQNGLGAEIFGDMAAGPGAAGSHSGYAGNIVWRWFTDPAWRASWVPRDCDEATASGLVADLRSMAAQRGHDPEAARLIGELRAASGEFAHRWDQHGVSRLRPVYGVLRHPRAGVLSGDCGVMEGQAPGQRLFLFRTVPGTPASGRLAALARPASRV